MLDLSTIYGVNDDALAKIRKGERGMLILEKRNQRYVPQDINHVRLNPRKTEKVENNSTEQVIDKKSMKTEENNLKENVTETENNIERTIRSSEDFGNTTGGLKSEDVCIQNKDNDTTCYQFG